MKRIFALLVMLSVLCGYAISANAVLINRGGGMIYSTDLNVTWLQDANYARTSGYDADGLMNWNEAMAWAGNLVYGGYDDWRLPTFDPSNPSVSDRSPIHEMGYLYHVELGNVGTLTNTGPFINVVTVAPDGGISDWYWTGTEGTAGGSGTSFDPNLTQAWRFSFSCG